MRSLKEGAILTSLVLFLWLLPAAQKAEACGCLCDHLCPIYNDCCPWCLGGPSEQIGPSATVAPLGANRALVTISGAITTSMEAATSCATGFEAVTGIASIDAVRLVNLASGEVIYDFLANPNSTDSFEALAAARPRPAANELWAGFQGFVLEDVPDGLVTAFAVEVTLQQGVSLQQLARAIRREGSFGGGSSAADGSLDLHHYFLRSFRNIPVTVSPGLAGPRGSGK